MTRIRNNTFTHARLKILVYVCFIEHDWTDCGNGGVGITLIPRESLYSIITITNNLTQFLFFFFSLFIPAKALAKLFACDANKLNKKNELRKTRSTETQLITICLATYVQRRIERREKLPPRKVPTHLEITGKKSVTNGVA